MKRVGLILFALITALPFGFASEQLDTFTWLYDGSTTIQERYAIIRGVAEEKIPDAGELYQKALRQLLLEYPSLTDNTDREEASAFVRLLAGVLGDIRYAASAGELWKAQQLFSNPVVKAEILTAIGRTRSAEYVEKITLLLSNLNAVAPGDKETGEKIAYGAILALEKFRVPESYPAVFFAANAWYNKRVKNQAAATLPILVDDPSDSLITILKQGDSAIKILALQRSEESKAANDSKSKVALVALADGWNSTPRDQQERQLFAQLRKNAMANLIKHGVPNEALKYLEKSYKEGVDMEERLSSIQTITVNKSDDAAAALGSFLMIYNNKRRDGVITADDERIVRALIPSIGAIGSLKSRSVLQTTQYMNWTPAIQTLAAEAMKNLK